MDLPAGVDEFARVEISEDKEWRTEFVPWLEDLERNGVGVEDGFLVASISSEIRKVNAGNESNFLETCLPGLQSVVIQRLQQFGNVMAMHYGVQSLVNESKLEKFREETVDCREYGKETCCTTILREHGLPSLMNYLDLCMHALKTRRHGTNVRGWATSSRVIAEELGDKLKKKYLNLIQSADNFEWESNKGDPPKTCEEAECCLNSDSEESGSDDEDEMLQVKRGKAVDSQAKVDLSNTPLYGFGNSDDVKIDLKITDNFCMKRLVNLLWLLPHKIPGFHSSYYFYGTRHSLFPVHVEDALTLSMNYLFLGQPKLWVMIPPWATSLLEFHLKNCGSFLTYMHCSNFMGHKSLAPTVQFLLQFNIPFKIVVQCPGDLVILYPNTAHFGFNLGRNFAEAINFSIPSWVPWGVMAPKCSCLGKQIHIPMKPFVVAFRPDLLESLENGRPVTTPQFVRGMQLLSSEIEKIGKRHSKTLGQDLPTPIVCKRSREDKKCPMKKGRPGPSTSSTCEMKGEDSKKCPLPKCTVNCQNIKDMVKHVRASHRPLLRDQTFVEQIDKLFTKSS